MGRMVERMGGEVQKSQLSPERVIEFGVVGRDGVGIRLDERVCDLEVGVVKVGDVVGGVKVDVVVGDVLRGVVVVVVEAVVV